MRAVRTVLAVVVALVTSMSIPLAPAEADPGRRPRLTARRSDRGQDRCDGHSRGDRQLADPRPDLLRQGIRRRDTATGGPMLVDDHTRIGGSPRRSPVPPSFSSSIKEKSG